MGVYVKRVGRGQQKNQNSNRCWNIDHPTIRSTGGLRKFLKSRPSGKIKIKGRTMRDFNHVNYLWDDKKAAALKGDEVALLIYRSNLLGADLRLTNYGGGNTSCKLISPDPLTGDSTEVMWIKGSGGDLGSLKRSGLSGLYMERLLNLRKIYRGLSQEDEMVALFDLCLFDPSSKTPSIDTPLHGFLPFRHIDHL